MSKDCSECDYFEGYTSEGEPLCSYDEEGGVGCPYNDESSISEEKMEDGVKFEIDATFFTEYVRETIRNTVQHLTRTIVEREIKNIITATYQKEIKALTKVAMSKAVDTQVAEFMADDISLGGGWMEEPRTLSRKEYLAELVEKELADYKNESKVKTIAHEVSSKAINDFISKMKNEINAGINEYFNSATRQVLTENVVSMLMSNETYQRMAQSMKHFLPEGTQGERP